jgi:hypothetical protein
MVLVDFVIITHPLRFSGVATLALRGDFVTALPILRGPGERRPQAALSKKYRHLELSNFLGYENSSDFLSRGAPETLLRLTVIDESVMAY